MFVFYDTETTGTNVAFDQIIQFAAVLTDENFQELDRLDIKCKVLPWIIPSPKALLVTNTSPLELNDPSRVSFFEMMGIVQEKLASWSPATFIGYNSLRFDEPFVHRALWQSLHEPYLTVTNGNKRSDLLLILRAAAHFLPDIFFWPLNDAGKIGFRLDQIAPLNGFDHCNAHDALADVEATIFLAKKLAATAPDFWGGALARSSKAGIATILAARTPVLVFEYLQGQPITWFGQRIDRPSGDARDALLARLSFDWGSVREAGMPEIQAIFNTVPSVVRTLRLNKSPVIFTAHEAELLFGIRPSPHELEQAAILEHFPEIASKIATEFMDRVPTDKGEELEQRIYDGFPSRPDQNLMKEFQRSDWRRRLEISDVFEDQRLRLLSKRLIFFSASEVLPTHEAERIQSGIASRRNGVPGTKVPWRTINDALEELRILYDDPSLPIVQLRAIAEWLEQMNEKV